MDTLSGVVALAISRVYGNLPSFPSFLFFHNNNHHHNNNSYPVLARSAPVPPSSLSAAYGNGRYSQHHQRGAP